MLLLISLAMATDVVVAVTGSPEESVARVKTALGDPDADLKGLTLSTVLSGAEPMLLGGGVLVPCVDRTSTASALERSLTLGEGAIRYMDHGSARADLDAAIRDLECLETPVNAVAASRAFFLRGLLEINAGDSAGAGEDFLRARRFRPDLTWDPNFSPTARPAFEAAMRAADDAVAVPVRLLPAPVGGVLVEGRSVDLIDEQLFLAPGAHVVQLAGIPTRTISLVVEAGTAPTLVLPERVSPDVLLWADDDRRADLATVLTTMLGDEGAAYVVTPAAVWRLVLRTRTWDRLDDDEPAPPTIPLDGRPARPAREPPRVAQVLLASLGATAIGAGAGLYAEARVNAANPDYATLANNDQSAADAYFARAVRPYYLAGLSLMSLGAVGVAGGGTWFFLTDQGAGVGARWAW